METNKESFVFVLFLNGKKDLCSCKRWLGSDFCDYCDKEFKAGSEQKEEKTHIRDAHTV